jgi:Ser/Thr protein kinase RdoA (MazF antagonist)
MAPPDPAGLAAELWGWRGSLAPLGGGAWLARGPAGRAVLKLHEPLARQSRRLLEAAHRAAAGAGLAPRLFPSRRGRLLEECPQGLASLQEWRPGRPPGPERAAEVGAALAALHRAWAGLEVGGADNHLVREVPAVAAAAAAEGLAGLGPALERAAELRAASPAQLIHGDAHPGNLLAAGRWVLFVDLDSAHHGPPALDVAFAGYRLGGGDPDCLAAVARAYNRLADRPAPAGGLASLVAEEAARRLLFILRQARRGRREYLYDLEAQQAHLARALELAGGGRRPARRLGP